MVGPLILLYSPSSAPTGPIPGRRTVRCLRMATLAGVDLRVENRDFFYNRRDPRAPRYFTVTLLARLRGMSGSKPRSTAR